MTSNEIKAYTRLFRFIEKNKEKEPYRLLYSKITEDRILRIVFNVVFELEPLSLTSNITMLTTEQVSKALDVSVRTLAQWRKDGVLPCTIWKGKAHYDIAQIHKTIEAGLQSPSRNQEKVV
ncbi:MAG: hypothetical protein CVT94_10900 [Bacteroidetes bacterium HGW-Bacteroidetes-11]|nr:MAG: hypothetical protein CVT94_10900 [Bacteroidetes bacterium HGW-Bacteroidetes-11]